MSQEPKNLVCSSEAKLFKVSVVVSALLWLMLTVLTLGIGLMYAVFFGGMIYLMHGIMLAHIKGYGVKVSAQQFPELYKLIEKSAKDMGFYQIPTLFVLQYGGMINAFATHFLSRDFVILTSDMLDACEDDPQLLSFVITHELTHLQRKHTQWNAFLAPSRLIPFLGMAYSRACEYTCDAHAAHFGTQSLDQAVRAVQVLSAGSKRWAAKINPEAYHNQLAEEKGVLSTMAEINSTHPFTAKRVDHLRRVIGGEDIPQVKHSTGGVLLSLFFNQQLFVLLMVIFSLVFVMQSIKEFKEAFEAQMGGSNLSYLNGVDALDGADESYDYYTGMHENSQCDELYSYYVEDTDAGTSEELVAYKTYQTKCENDEGFYDDFYPNNQCNNAVQAYFSAPLGSDEESTLRKAYLDCESLQVELQAQADAVCADERAAYDEAMQSGDSTKTNRLYYEEMLCRSTFIEAQNQALLGSSI